jgi:capsule polysaccharide export protein KpsE/RkpR
MDIVARLLLREEIDALEHDLSAAKSTPNPDFARVQGLKQEIARLEQRFAASRRAQSERKFAR